MRDAAVENLLNKVSGSAADNFFQLKDLSLTLDYYLPELERGGLDAANCVFAARSIPHPHSGTGKRMKCYALLHTRYIHY